MERSNSSFSFKDVDEIVINKGKKKNNCFCGFYSIDTGFMNFICIYHEAAARKKLIPRSPSSIKRIKKLKTPRWSPIITSTVSPVTTNFHCVSPKTTLSENTDNTIPRNYPNENGFSYNYHSLHLNHKKEIKSPATTSSQTLRADNMIPRTYKNGFIFNYQAFLNQKIGINSPITNNSQIPYEDNTIPRNNHITNKNRFNYRLLNLRHKNKIKKKKYIYIQTKLEELNYDLDKLENNDIDNDNENPSWNTPKFTEFIKQLRDIFTIEENILFGKKTPEYNNWMIPINHTEDGDIIMGNLAYGFSTKVQDKVNIKIPLYVSHLYKPAVLEILDTRAFFLDLEKVAREAYKRECFELLNERDFAFNGIQLNNNKRRGSF